MQARVEEFEQTVHFVPESSESVPVSAPDLGQRLLDVSPEPVSVLGTANLPPVPRFVPRWKQIVGDLFKESTPGERRLCEIASEFTDDVTM